MKYLCKCNCRGYAKPGNRFIHGHQSKGNKASDETRRRISESKIKAYKTILIDEERFCECGCKQLVTRKIKYPHNWNRFIHGHNKDNYYQKGHMPSIKTKEKISQSNMGRSSWNKGLNMKELGYITWNRGKKLSDKHIQHLSESHMGNPAWNKDKKMSLEQRKKLSIANTGHKHTKEACLNMGVSHMKCRTDGYCDAWSDREYKRNCKKSFCELCGMTKQLSFKVYNMNLILHHVTFDKKRCHPWNLQTVCISCHSSLHHEARRKNKTNFN